LISDALFLEATSADAALRRPVDAGSRSQRDLDDVDERSISELSELESPPVPPEKQAQTIAQWIYDGREDASEKTSASFPGLGWLRQPKSHSDREWILEIAQQYRELSNVKTGTV
jgi:hypothetical protein